MTRSAFNTEFDSRIVRVSAGAFGVTRPKLSLDGSLAQTFCLNCGKPMGAVSSVIPPALRGDPSVITVCTDCDGKLGTMPTHARSYVRYKESD